MQQLPPSGLNCPFSKAARALLPVSFVVVFAQPGRWPCATHPRWALDLGTGSERQQGPRGRILLAEREPRKKSSWPGGVGCAADGAISARPLIPREGSREAQHQISVGLHRSAAGMHWGRKFHFAWPMFAPVLQPDSSVCISRFHELRLPGSKLHAGCSQPPLRALI